YRVYPAWDDVVQEIEVNGVPTEVVNRPQEVASNVSWGSGTNAGLIGLGSVGTDYLGAFETDTLPGRNGSFFGGAASSHAVQSYTPGTFYREREARWEPSGANFATGIGVFFSRANGNQS